MPTIAAGRPLICLLALLAACGQPAANATATNTVNSSKTSASEVRKMTTIEIDAGPHKWTAQISDTPSARDFLAQLPLDLTLTDYAATEKVATLPRPLTRDGAPAAVTPRAGEIGFYAPWGNIVLYYKDGPHSPGLVILGRIDDPYADLAKPGAVKVTIRRYNAAPAVRRPSE
ncbi:cyclophilin-like fold protein [Sphingomonas sp. 2R-10]|uniref:cyclophilin-like fold protein n=1 Tax=Sphingomonas sp. 2R-10 TaxID=3045148 RepID=UPI0019D16462|nr:cyclophilin-like fold protein [Sphingomonas sp. 2R-10]MDJ0276227.1 cyclophilin-like fold protein [Sphingomonas sp. 2R-10]